MITLKTKLGNESLNNQSKLINWYPALKRYCRVITKSNWDGEDLAQETIAKMFKSYTDNEGSFNDRITLALMYRIAHNQWIDQLRKSSKENGYMYDEPSYEPMKRIPELYSIVEKLGQTLNLNQIIIFILKDVFDYSLADISEQLSMSEGSIKASLFRTRNRIKSIVNREHPVDERLVIEKDKEIQQLTRILIDSIRKENPMILIKLYHEKRTKKYNISPSSRFDVNSLHLQAA